MNPVWVIPGSVALYVVGMLIQWGMQKNQIQNDGVEIQALKREMVPRTEFTLATTDIRGRLQRIESKIDKL